MQFHYKTFIRFLTFFIKLDSGYRFYAWLQTEKTSHMHSPMAIINRCRFTYLMLLELDILLDVDDVATVVVATQGLLHFSV